MCLSWCPHCPHSKEVMRLIQMDVVCPSIVVIVVHPFVMILCLPFIVIVVVLYKKEKNCIIESITCI